MDAAPPGSIQTLALLRKCREVDAHAKRRSALLALHINHHEDQFFDRGEFAGRPWAKAVGVGQPRGWKAQVECEGSFEALTCLWCVVAPRAG